MIGVRKSLDWIFTKDELRALDDLMPESSKKKHDRLDDEEVKTVSSLHSVYCVPVTRNSQKKTFGRYCF